MDKYQRKSAVWRDRIFAAEKVYREWENRFDVGILNDFYEGKQWGEYQIPDTYKPYVLNLIQSSINIKLPGLLLENPRFDIEPKIIAESDNVDAAYKRAQIKEGVLNTIVGDDDLEFNDTMELVFLSTFLAFGVVEVNYSADWIKNENTDRPALKSDEGKDDSKKGKIEGAEEYIPQKERVFVKYIDPESFRVSANSHHKLKRCEWCGYYEYIRTEDLLARSDYRKPQNLAAFSQARSPEFSTGAAMLDNLTEEEQNLFKNGDLTKVWFLWDHRTKEHLVFSEENSHIFKITKYEVHPIETLRFSLRKKGWYPIPPVYHWISPQREYNEAREMARNHRRRAISKFTYLKGTFTSPEELEKYEQGGDGTLAEVSRLGGIEATPRPSVGQDVNNAMVVSKDDFNIISATSAEQRGVADRVTATQASISDTYAQIRESKDQIKGANFLIKIAKKILKIVQTKFTLPVLYEMIAHDSSALFEEVQQAQSLWYNASPEDLEGDDYKVKIQVSSMSPVANEKEKAALFEFLAIVNQYPQVAMSPRMLMKVADIIGFKDHKILREFQQMAILAMVGQMQQAGNSGMDQRQVEKSTPDTQAQIENQLGKQVGLV